MKGIRKRSLKNEREIYGKKKEKEEYKKKQIPNLYT